MVFKFAQDAQLNDVFRYLDNQQRTYTWQSNVLTVTNPIEGSELVLHIFKQWYSRKFSDPNSITLLMLTLGLAAAFYFFGTYIIPVMVALVIAYLLDWPVQKTNGIRACLALFLALWGC